jgi:predicted MFS family arabinose efflux permease
MMFVSLSVDGFAGFGWSLGMIAAVMLTGIGCLAAYWQRAAQQEHPLFAPSLFAVPTVSIGLLGNLFSRLGGSGVPFLIPLMLQLKMGYSPSQAGMMMLPLAGAGMLVKRCATWSISRYGYRYVLVANTVAIGAMIASFSLMDHTPMWLLIPQLALFGACNSLQFTGMNSLALSGLQPEQASSGNGLLSMVQMLAIGLGVALAGALLAASSAWWQARTGQANSMAAFRTTLICMGAITWASSWIFWQLPPDAAQTSAHSVEADFPAE